MDEGRRVGVRGMGWRAVVDRFGTVHPDDGTAPLGWYVAGDERWYSPATEPTLRQKWYAGLPVCETRLRVGTGDVVQRIYCVADAGGICVVEFENETALPVAVALTRGDLLTVRDIVGAEPQGIDLPAGSIVLPLGHRATTRVGLAHAGSGRGRLPQELPDHGAVVRGWEAACDVASRLVLPDHNVVAQVARVRSDILLDDESEGAVIEAVRMGHRDRDAIVGVVDVVKRRLKSERRARTLAWDTPHLLATAARACVLLDDDVAAGDIAAAWLSLADRPIAEPPAQMPVGPDAVAWAEGLLAQGSPSGGQCHLFPRGIPRPWWGAPLEAHGLVGDPHRPLSFAVRWHGERPAVLWEVSGVPGLVLDGGVADPGWHSAESSGETLWAPMISDR